MQEPLIRAKYLSKKFSESDSSVYALNGASFEIYRDEFVGLSGVSGSGKTTLLGILGCLETPSSGELELFGHKINQLKDRELSDIRLRNIGFIFQEHNLLPALTVQENLEIPLSLLKVDKRKRIEKVEKLLSIVKLEELRDRYPSQLSRGQRQRIAAVRAFANDPMIILADEPTSDLDPENASILLNFLKEMNKEKGTTIIVAATDPAIFNGLTTRTLRLVDGKII